jgi:hypothetical protein
MGFWDWADKHTELVGWLVVFTLATIVISVAELAQAWGKRRAR